MENSSDSQTPNDERQPDWNFYDGMIYLHNEVGDERFDEALTDLFTYLESSIDLDAPISSIYVKSPVKRPVGNFRQIVQSIKEKLNIPRTPSKGDARTIEGILRGVYSQYCIDVGSTYVDLITARGGNIRMASATGFNLDLRPKIMALANAAAVINSGLAISRSIREESENGDLELSAIITECMPQELSEKVSPSTLKDLIDSLSRHVSDL